MLLAKVLKGSKFDPREADEVANAVKALLSEANEDTKKNARSTWSK